MSITLAIPESWTKRQIDIADDWLIEASPEHEFDWMYEDLDPYAEITIDDEQVAIAFRLRFGL